ncbi:hypothetical protein [Ruminococcus sp.]|uniref:hypothetical protein n=1 Tax=Ruminococcus sp. TaxID=41978 RepID=UPI0025EA186F|nr:hypothetical protein [Ruminococcus sp.]
MRAVSRILAFSIAGTIVMLTGCKEVDSNGDLHNDSISVEESSQEAELTKKIRLKEIDEYYSIVCSSVAYQLENAGFQAAFGVASSSDKNDYQASGVYYHCDELEFWEDESYQSVGFVEVVNDSEPFRDVSSEEYMISVADINAPNSDIQQICTYNYEAIGSQHFVYQNKYITYYQQSPMRVVYSVLDNNEENYVFDLGSIYDYDTQEYIYDASIFEEEYVTHSGIPFNEEIDYKKLEKELKQISMQQDENGYLVESYEVAYISPENMQAYIDSKEEDTFFGKPVSELTKAFGAGSALVFENGEGKKARNLNNSGDDDYQWSEGLKKCSAGAGALLFSAIIRGVGNPTAIAIDFLIVLAEPVSEGLIAGLYALAIDTAANIENGAGVEEAIQIAAPHAFKTFTDKFTMTAAKVAAQNVVGKYYPWEGLRRIAQSSISSFNDPQFQESVNTIVEYTETYNATVSTLNDALHNINPDLDIQTIQSSIQSQKQKYHDTIIQTGKEAAEYLTVSVNNAADKAITVLMMPWTQIES